MVSFQCLERMNIFSDIIADIIGVIAEGLYNVIGYMIHGEKFLTQSYVPFHVKAISFSIVIILILSIFGIFVFINN